MQIRIFSDIHLEFGDFQPKELPNDKNTTLIIAGDLSGGLKGTKKFLGRMTDQFGDVILVPGNHDYYGYEIQEIDEHYRNKEHKIKNFHYLNPGVFLKDNVRFIGACLWTDYDNENPLIMNEAARIMRNEMSLIKVDEEIHSYPSIFSGINKEHRAFIKQQLDIPFEGKTVIISHHAPILDLVWRRGEDSFKFSTIFGNTKMEEFFVPEANYQLWIHGHTHTFYDNTVNGHRILCNPRGYIGYEPGASKYNDALILEV